MGKKHFFEPYPIDDQTSEKMKERMLNLLLYFLDFCKQHNLLCYLIGGGAIGAVREHGFVPWDDDIDLAMPRPDYEKFHELWNEYGDKDRFVLCRTDRNINYHHSASSLRDPNTTFICTYNKYNDICHGIALEFGPIDATPNSKILQYKQVFYSFLYEIFNNQRLPYGRGGLARRFTKIIYILVPSKAIRDKIWMYADKQRSKYSWENCRYVKELLGKTSFYNFPKEWYEHAVYFEFEGYQVPLMAGYHEYLSLIFGDYMKRPPIEQQVAKHDLIFVDMDHPYTNYKGIYYFPD